jgi:hypothetical protein
MAITFEDGTVLPADDWYRIMTLVKQRAKEGAPPPTEITQGGVTIKLAGLEAKKDAKITAGSGPEYSKYVESTYKGWKIRVWNIAKDSVYGCNYFRDEDIRYMEVAHNLVKDENGVFKYVQCFIDEISDE